MAIRTLAHHIDVEFLRVAYNRTRKDGAVVVDDQTAADYAAQLESNLQSLLDRFKSGTYRARNRSGVGKAGSSRSLVSS